jgi:CBS domain containing-hemolysin-like protein
MITLEDLLEEIVGEIRDEYDEDEENELVEVAPQEYLVEGSMKLDDLNDRLNLELESEDYDSIAGLIIGLLDRLPEQGEEVVCNDIRLVVEALDKNRIDKVRMYLGVEETGQSKRD